MIPFVADIARARMLNLKQDQANQGPVPARIEVTGILEIFCGETGFVLGIVDVYELQT